MKLAVVTLLVLAAYAQARILEDLEVTSAYNYLEKSVLIAEQRRKYEEGLISQRVIGGSNAAQGQFPYQAGLQILIPNVGTGVCGGSLVSANRVVTAAHCWFDGINQAASITVRLGSIFIFGTDGVTVTSLNVRTHPDWFPWLVRNDIAMIVLPSSVSITNTVAPISLPAGSEAEDNFVGQVATLSGFGLTQNGGSVSQTLQHNSLAVISNLICATQFILPTLVQPTNICTSGAGNVGACNGDSGGPLAIQRSGRNILIGVVSFGAPPAQGGCEGGRPTAYARVTSYLDWFRSQM